MELHNLISKMIDRGHGSSHLRLSCGSGSCIICIQRFRMNRSLDDRSQADTAPAVLTALGASWPWHTVTDVQVQRWLAASLAAGISHLKCRDLTNDQQEWEIYIYKYDIHIYLYIHSNGYRIRCIYIYLIMENQM